MIDGYVTSRIVKINGKDLDPAASQALMNHSPDGFAWGYGGSGPAQLALALLLRLTTKAFALEHYQDFKSQVIAALPAEDGFKMTTLSVRVWARDHGWKGDTDHATS